MGEAAFKTDIEDSLSIDERLLNLLESRGYRVFEKVGEGFTRRVFRAKYNVGDVERVRVVKIPKTNEEVNGSGSVNTKINLSKADVNKREVYSSNALNHPNVSAVVDSFDFNWMTINMEEDFDGRSLEDRIKDGWRPGEKDINGFCMQTFDALGYLFGKGILHRDFKPSNVLIANNGFVKITDLQNAVQSDSLAPGILPSHGASAFAHPRLLNSPFKEEESCAGFDTEIYSLGCTLYYALTGRLPFDYKIVDDNNGKLLVVGNNAFGASLLVGGERVSGIDGKEHNARLNKALKELSGWKGKYNKILRRCLTLDDDKKYSSIDELKGDLEKIVNPGLFNRIRDSLWTKITAAGLVAGIGVGGWVLQNHLLEKEQALKIAIEEGKKYEVGAAWDASNLEISNNFVTLNVRCNKEKVPYDTYPDKKALYVEQGDSLWTNVHVKEVARHRIAGVAAPSLEGKIYFEGYPGVSYGVLPDPYNEEEAYEAMGIIGNWMGRVIVPRDIPEGIHYLAVELYAHEKLAGSEFKFMQPGKVINRKRVPVVVGNPSSSVALSAIHLLDYYERVHFKSLREGKIIPGSLIREGEIIPGSLQYECSIPEEKYFEVLKSDRDLTYSYSDGLSLPPGTRTDESTLKVQVKDGQGKLVSITYLPVCRRKITNTWYLWGLSMPGRDFSERLEKIRLGRD